MLFRLSYPPFDLYSKPNLQVTCACHCFNRYQHSDVILMDNNLPVKRTDVVSLWTRSTALAYQPSGEQGHHKPQGSQEEPAWS